MIDANSKPALAVLNQVVGAKGQSMHVEMIELTDDVVELSISTGLSVAQNHGKLVQAIFVRLRKNIWRHRRREPLKDN